MLFFHPLADKVAERRERDALTRQQQIGFSRRFYGSIGSKSTERTKLESRSLPLPHSPHLRLQSLLAFTRVRALQITKISVAFSIFSLLKMKLCQCLLKLLTINWSHMRGVYSEVDSTKRVEFPSTRRFYMAKTLMLPSSRSIHSLPPSVTEQRE